MAFELCEVDKPAPQMKQSYMQTMGSGWFWCHRSLTGWSVNYVNAMWGANVDGRYVRMDNFDDVIGPLEEPKAR